MLNLDINITQITAKSEIGNVILQGASILHSDVHAKRISCRIYLHMPTLGIMITHTRSISQPQYFRHSFYSKQSIIVRHLQLFYAMRLRSLQPSLFEITKNVVSCRPIDFTVQIVPWFSRTTSCTPLSDKKLSYS